MPPKQQPKTSPGDQPEGADVPADVDHAALAPRPSRALRATLESVEHLTTAERMRLLETLGKHLDAPWPEEPPWDARVREKAEALRQIAAVSQHLELSNGQRPTARQFNEICRPILGSPWNATRVGRAWGLWRVAVDVHLGAKPRDGYGREAVALVRGFRRQGRRAPHESLDQWLSSDSAGISVHSYDKWVAATNRELDADELPHAYGSGVVNAMNTTFARAVRAARKGQLPAESGPGETSGYRGDDKGLTLGGQRLLTVRGVAAELGIGDKYAAAKTRTEGFPSQVAVVGRSTLWLEEDVIAFREGRMVRRKHNALGHQLLGSRDMSERLGIIRQTLDKGIRRKSTFYPRPDGFLGESAWWSAATLERWLRDHPERR